MPPADQQRSPVNDSPRISRLRLALECALLFLGVPGAVAAGWIRAWVIPLLLLAALGCGLTLRWRYQIRFHDLFRSHVPRQEWRRILIIYALALPGLVLLLWLIKPTALFGLMLHHPKLWLLIMVAYPLVSVLPQELIYRAFFFERYRPLFGQGVAMLLATATLFALGHIVFRNWPAVLLTGIGGWLFATTYRRTASLWLTCVEHALYGCAIFTIGYGEFFFDGTLRLVR